MTESATMPSISQRTPLPADTSLSILKIAVFAVGGQGGGVLSNWIADLATRGGYAVQMTSVAGVAQRTGATIYYLEMAPKAERQPVFALTPSPGDVDVVIAAELIEAGRAVVRDFVTVDRTTLIASTHRVLAVNEKLVPGDGRADSPMILDEIETAAYKAVCFDMQTLAEDAGSMISASLFGALAKSNALPFTPTLFEEVIQHSGRGVEQSLAAFNSALHYDSTSVPDDTTTKTNYTPVGPAHLVNHWQTLEMRVQSFAQPVQSMVQAGLRKVVDYQDVDYGDEYLQRLQPFMQYASSDAGIDLVLQAAKNIANAMCYDDILRVADLKTRAGRHTRLLAEQQTDPSHIVHVTEYFHPRAEEFCGTLPASLGAWIEQRPGVFNWFDRRLNKGRRIRTDSLMGFGMLWVVSQLRPRRRKLLRHQYESEHINALVKLSLEQATVSCEVASELLKCQRLIKGYADTHSRGQSKFKRVTEVLRHVESIADAAAILSQLREAALEDETGDALECAIKKNIGYREFLNS